MAAWPRENSPARPWAEAAVAADAPVAPPAPVAEETIVSRFAHRALGLQHADAVTVLAGADRAQGHDQHRPVLNEIRPSARRARRHLGDLVSNWGVTADLRGLGGNRPWCCSRGAGVASTVRRIVNPANTVA